MTHTEHENFAWTISVSDHPARADSTTYWRSRKSMIAAVQQRTTEPWASTPPASCTSNGSPSALLSGLAAVTCVLQNLSNLDVASVSVPAETPGAPAVEVPAAHPAAPISEPSAPVA